MLFIADLVPVMYFAKWVKQLLKNVIWGINDKFVKHTEVLDVFQKFRRFWTRNSSTQCNTEYKAQDASFPFGIYTHTCGLAVLTWQTPSEHQITRVETFRRFTSLNLIVGWVQWKEREQRKVVWAILAKISWMVWSLA